MAQRFFSFPKIRSLIVVLVGVAAAVATRGDVSSAAITTATPFDVFASGFEDPSGLAVESDGTVLVTDRRAGTLTRVTPAGARQIILNNLHDPRGVAAGAGGVFVLEGGVRVLRLDQNGIVSLVTASLKQARAIAAGPDGRIWIAARHEHGPEYEIARLETSGMLTRVASGLADVRALAVDHAGIYVALESLAGEGRDRTTLARLPWRSDGRLGPVESLLRNTPRAPDGVAIDAAGDVVITGSRLEHLHPGSGVVLKRRAGGEVALVASGLSRPGAGAFGPGRELFVIEEGAPARVIRFRPPSPPIVNVPAFTNRTPLRIAGRAQAGSLVQVLSIPAGRVLAVGAADSPAGAFVVSAPLVENAETRLSIVATARAGTGLLGLPAIASAVHDDHLPAVEILDPLAAAHVRDAFVFRARARDDGSGIATLRLMIDQLTHTIVPTAADSQPLVAAALFDTSVLREGPHSLTASGTDRAGNWGSAAQLIVVDRTPPDTSILTGPPAETADRSATFTFGGSDEQSPDLEFAWRLDGGPWSAFARATTAELTGLAPGPHRFEAAARDRAGNVDATPAGQAFTVIALRVRIVEPAPGTAIATQTIWVRGTIEGPPDVALTIPLPEAFRKVFPLEALAAPQEAGTFAAEVPVIPGMNALTVIARDRVGGVATDTVAISVAEEPLSSSRRLDPWPPAGLAPHGVHFRTNGFPAGSVYSLDLESDGIVDYTGNAVPEQEFVYARPGIHVATLRVATPDAQTLVARGGIEVYDRARLEARLRAAWAGFKAALRGGDAAAAASFVHSDRRAAWADAFSRFTPAQFAATDAVFTDITLVEVTPGRAECEMMRDAGGLLYSFPVSFEIDVDGGWKLWQF